MRDWLKLRFPYLYWKVRNGVALAQWCVLQLRARQSDLSEHDSYDDRFWSFHDGGYWDGFAQLITNQFKPQTIWDVGCGDGKLLASLAKENSTARLVGFDYSHAARRRAAARGVDVQPFDLSKLTPDAIRKLAAEFGPPDLAVCLEVAEHIPIWQSGRCLQLLASAPIVLFSAAQPLQGGVLHVNEQRPEYWARKFAKFGYERDPGNALLRTKVQELELPTWYGANLQVFRRTSKG